MGIQVIDLNGNGQYIFSGLSTDTKGSGSLTDNNGLTVKYNIGSKFYETDTSDFYEYIASWVKVGSVGVPKFNLSNPNDISFPADYVKEDSVTLTASATDELTISNMDGYKTLQFTVSGLTTDTLAVRLGYDTDVPPTLVSSEVAVHSLAQTTGTTNVLLTTGSNGDYMITDLACKSVWFDRTGGTDTPVITWKARKS